MLGDLPLYPEREADYAYLARALNATGLFYIRLVDHVSLVERPWICWHRIMDTLAAGHDAAVQMIDTSIVRVHQQGACVSWNKRQSMGRSRGGLTGKIHAVVDGNGLPVRLAAHSRRSPRQPACNQAPVAPEVGGNAPG